jgi:hypothetical protein
MSYLRYLCLLSHIALCFRFVFLRPVFLILPVSLVCSVLIAS